MKTYAYPYRTEFPDSSERGRNSKTLEDALYWARWHVHRIWSETNEYGREGEYIYDTATAVITNRNTGCRWIVRRGDHRVEFQTPQMLDRDKPRGRRSPRPRASDAKKRRRKGRRQGTWSHLLDSAGTDTDPDPPPA